QYADADDDLPTTERIGMHLMFDEENNPGWWDSFKNKYSLYVDGGKPKNESSSMNTGLEISRNIGSDNFLSKATFRAGYTGALQAPTLGAGFKFGYLTLDYGINFVDSFDLAHRFTLILQFKGKNSEEENEHINLRTLSS